VKEGIIPKDTWYEELIAGKCYRERLQLVYRKACKQDMYELNIDLNKWEELVMDRSKWRSYLYTTLKVGLKNIITALENKRRL